MGRRSEWIFFQGRYIDGQQVQAKVFNIINHQGIVRVHFTHARMAIIKVQNETDDILSLVRMYKN